MLKPYAYNSYDVYYGLGLWIIKNEKGIVKYYITGSDPGVSFESSVYVNENIEVTILGNREFETFNIIKEIG